MCRILPLGSCFCNYCHQQIYIMAQQTIEHKTVTSRPRWSNVHANGGVLRSPPAAAAQRPVLNPAQVYDLVYKVCCYLVVNRK